MKDEELQREKSRLINLSDSLVNRSISDGMNSSERLMGILLSGCFALILAAIPAFIVSFFFDFDKVFLVFCASIIYQGCFEIAYAIRGQAHVHWKTSDNLNAIRLAIFDLSNRVESIDKK